MDQDTNSSNLFDLSGKTACVTGASSGLGRRAATYLAGQGVRVIGIARRKTELEQWQSETGGDTHVLVADLSGHDQALSIARLIIEGFGQPDILINAAGINTRQEADNVSAEGWQQTLDINLTTPFFLAQQLVPGMKQRKWGRIVNFASLQSFRAFPGGISYGASKGAIAQLTRAMAEAWSFHGINANAIAPGFFKTELTAAVFDDKERANANAAQTCIGRNGRDEDLDGPLHFLCSDASAYVTGQVLSVDGGFTAK